MQPAPAEPNAVETGDLADQLLDEVEKAIIGKRAVLEIVLMAMLSMGHVLIEDFPGLAKTLMARAFAQVSDLRFSRIQFTPDLMPMDITGSAVRDPGSGELVFRPGPIFTNLLLADEVNRAPAKTQAALLEAMEERQVTSDGVTRVLDKPFLVIATQNPIEYEGTYPLPEAQLDRFLARVAVGYPDRDDEWRVVSDRVARQADEIRLEQKLEQPRWKRCVGVWSRSMCPKPSAATWSILRELPGSARRCMWVLVHAARWL